MVSSPPAPESFQTIRRERASGQIVEQLESAILGGRFRAGDRLPTERELAERFGTSRSSVREALRSLEQIGLVVVRQGAAGGAFVSEPGAGMVGQILHRLARLGQFHSVELYAARRILEPGVAASAALIASPERHASLRALLDEIRLLSLAGRDTAAASRRFHLLLAEATGNALLVLLTAALLDVAERLDQAIPHQPRPSRIVVDEHEAILDAVERGDAERASALMAEHLADLALETEAESRRASTVIP